MPSCKCKELKGVEMNAEDAACESSEILKREKILENQKHLSNKSLNLQNHSTLALFSSKF